MQEDPCQLHVGDGKVVIVEGMSDGIGPLEEPNCGREFAVNSKPDAANTPSGSITGSRVGWSGGNQLFGMSRPRAEEADEGSPVLE
mmetsp:Transcript_28715/g.47822  ORF Transcript_28715/g.47822 Transcript_28715/m.47822 type:complete len:86 (-) Transcript_28715:942-1199(-)